MWLLLLLLKSNNGKHFLIETSGDTDIKVNELAGYNNERNAESGHDYMLPRRGHRDEIMDNTVEELDELIDEGLRSIDTTPTVGCIGQWNGFRAISCLRQG